MAAIADLGFVSLLLLCDPTLHVLFEPPGMRQPALIHRLRPVKGMRVIGKNGHPRLWCPVLF